MTGASAKKATTEVPPSPSLPSTQVQVPAGRQGQPAPHSHVAARAGLDGALGRQAALHHLVEARIPDVLGELRRQNAG